jgi:hypothetical protein
MNLSEMQAEQYKHTYGLRTDLLKERAATLQPLMNDWSSQINKIYLFRIRDIKEPEQIVWPAAALLPGDQFLVENPNTKWSSPTRSNLLKTNCSINSGHQWANPNGRWRPV